MRVGPKCWSAAACVAADEEWWSRGWLGGTAGAEAEAPASGCGSRVMANRCRFVPRYLARQHQEHQDRAPYCYQAGKRLVEPIAGLIQCALQLCVSLEDVFF